MIIFRRSVKAIFLLFPLFGIQLLAITNRVPLTSVNYFWFNIVSEIVIGSKVKSVSVFNTFDANHISKDVQKLLINLWKHFLILSPELNEETKIENKKPIWLIRDRYCYIRLTVDISFIFSISQWYRYNWREIFGKYQVNIFW